MLTLSTLLPCFSVVLLARSIQSLEKSIRYCEKYHEGQTEKIVVERGVVANPKEFPHAALIGYGNDENDYRFLCTGSLISDEFILTAAQCLNSVTAGPPKLVRLGDLDFDTATDDAAPQDFKVKESISHPRYKEPAGYNDIGLIRLDEKVQFNDYIRPACLDREKTFSSDLLGLSAGWGKIDTDQGQSTRLMKNALIYVDNKTCRRVHQWLVSSILPEGIVDDSQVCFAAFPGKKTCESVGGAPLQIIDKSKSSWHFSLVGVSSLGLTCGKSRNEIAIYTRVSNYVKWIENIVWPCKCPPVKL